MHTEPGDDFLPMLRKLLKTADPTILEVGANDGSDTERMLEAFPGARIFAFEPDPRAAKRFRQRLVNAKSVTLTEAAVGATDGLVKFHQSSGDTGHRSLDENHPDGWDLSGSIRVPKKHLDQHPWCTFDESISVPIVTLDNWTKSKGLEKVDFIWADVQGAELDLIAGANKTLARTRYFFTEYSDVELYEGQPNLSTIKSSLSGFRLRKTYIHDALFVNKSEIPWAFKLIPLR